MPNHLETNKKENLRARILAGEPIRSIAKNLSLSRNTVRKLIRQGKYFVLTLTEDLDQAEAAAEIDRIAREVLVNPVIEEYSYRLEF